MSGNLQVTYANVVLISRIRTNSQKLAAIKNSQYGNVQEMMYLTHELNKDIEQLRQSEANTFPSLPGQNIMPHINTNWKTKPPPPYQDRPQMHFDFLSGGNPCTIISHHDITGSHDKGHGVIGERFLH